MELKITTGNEYREDILFHLRKHNNKFTGGVQPASKSFYLIKDNELVAGLNAHLSWNWVSLANLYYQDLEALDIIVKQVASDFHDVIEGISYYTTVVKRMKDLEKVGFEVKTKVDGTVLLDPTYCMAYKPLTVKKDENIIISDTEIDEYQVILNNYEKVFKETNNLNGDQEVFTMAYYEENTFVGGIVAIIKKDSMYIDLLVVNESFKGQGIGSKLMNKIEELALEKEVVSIDLGTAEFQAKPFYEKLGYQVVYTKENNPKGYQCYSMKKDIK